jgi:hypothetical protein
MDKKIVPEHYQKHTITEYQHIPDHDAREDTLEFRNAKHELESVEHLPCFICGTMNKRQSHHIYERCWSNAFDFVKVAYFLFNHYDYHSHCRRDFKTAEEMAHWFADHFQGEWYDYYIELEQGEVSGPHKGLHCDDNALDTLYNQLIICYTDHQVVGEGAHGTTFPTFVAKMAAKTGFKVSLSQKEYDELKKEA